MTDFAIAPQTDPSTPSRRQTILGAAAQCFARSGFHGTSMHEICQEASMSPGAVYRYFRSKDEIISAIAEEERARNLSVLSQDSGGLPFVDHVLQLGLGFLAQMCEPGQAALMAEVFAECLRNTQIGQMFKSNEDDCKQIFRDLLSKAVAGGEVEAPADFDATMSCMMAIADGLVLRMAADPALTLDRIEPLMRLICQTLFKPKQGDPSAQLLNANEMADTSA